MTNAILWSLKVGRQINNLHPWYRQWLYVPAVVHQRRELRLAQAGEEDHRGINAEKGPKEVAVIAARAATDFPTNPERSRKSVAAGYESLRK